MKIAVTGHRPQRLNGQEKRISEWLHSKLAEIQSKAPIEAAFNGMAQGVDQLFALQCILLNVPVYCIFPYKRSKFHDAEMYILDKAAGITYIQDKYSKDSYYKRDCWMVDHCDILIAVWDGIPQGGTYLTIEYAKKMGKPIIYADAALFADLTG